MRTRACGGGRRNDGRAAEAASVPIHAPTKRATEKENTPVPESTDPVQKESLGRAPDERSAEQEEQPVDSEGLQAGIGHHEEKAPPRACVLKPTPHRFGIELFVAPRRVEPRD